MALNSVMKIQFEGNSLGFVVDALYDVFVCSFINRSDVIIKQLVVVIRLDFVDVSSFVCRDIKRFRLFDTLNVFV